MQRQVRVTMKQNFDAVTHTKTRSDQGSRNKVSLLIQWVEPVTKLGGDGACGPDGCDPKQDYLADDAPNYHWKIASPILQYSAHWECAMKFMDATATDVRMSIQFVPSRKKDWQPPMSRRQTMPTHLMRLDTAQAADHQQLLTG